VDDRLSGGILAGPDEDPLGPHLHVDPLVVPAEEALEEPRRLLLLRDRELFPHLPLVALPVRGQVAIVDLRRPLHEDADAAVDLGACRV
jgi:hypothetical protein